MFDITSVFWLLAIALLILYWFKALQVKDIAYAAAQRHCSEMEVQMLDQNVHLRRLWLKRDDRGKLFLWRAFYFEFTVTGEDRYVGRVLMLGPYLTQVQLDAHRMH